MAFDFAAAAAAAVFRSSAAAVFDSAAVAVVKSMTKASRLSI